MRGIILSLFFMFFLWCERICHRLICNQRTESAMENIDDKNPWAEERIDLKTSVRISSQNSESLELWAGKSHRTEGIKAKDLNWEAFLRRALLVIFVLFCAFNSSSPGYYIILLPTLFVYSVLTESRCFAPQLSRPRLRRSYMSPKIKYSADRKCWICAQHLLQPPI